MAPQSLTINGLMDNLQEGRNCFLSWQKNPPKGGETLKLALIYSCQHLQPEGFKRRNRFFVFWNSERDWSLGKLATIQELQLWNKAASGAKAWLGQSGRGNHYSDLHVPTFRSSLSNSHWLNPTRSQKASKPGGNTSEISLTRHRPRQRNDGLWISRHAKKG